MATATKDTKEYITTRGVLWYLVFFGFAVNYMLRINLNIAIVSMIKVRPDNSRALTSECLEKAKAEVAHNKTLISSTSNRTIIPFNITNPTATREAVKKIEEDETKKFYWDEKQQALVLGAFFWFHWSTQIPGGLLAQKYGTKLVFGLSNFAAVLCCFLIPMSAFMGYQYLIAIRAFQGIITGFAWPSMHNMAAKWIPPNERSKFVTAYLGSSVGAAITFPICGYIIHIWGWEYVFHVSGIVGTIWYAAWFILAFDSPSEHPRISEAEKDYILTSLGESVSKQKEPVPWRHLLTSLPIWMNVLAQWGGVWGLFTLMTHAPTYFKVIHGWNIRATGWLSGMPHFMRMVVAYAVSQAGDYLLRANLLSRSNVRKLATAICCIGQACCMLGLSFSGCNYLMAIVMLTAATASHGAVSTGPLASIVDISPNYASVSLGVCNTVIACMGFLTPLVVGHLTFENQTVGQWQKVFWIASGMLFVTGILYVLFSKSELQPWNSPKQMKAEENMEEMEALNKLEKNSYKNSDDKLPEKEEIENVMN